MGVSEIISDTDLLLMQQESRERHIPVKKKRNRRSGLRYKKREVGKPAHDPLPDLMAEMIANAPEKPPRVAQEVEIQPQIEISTPTVISERKAYFAPKEKKEILKWERPIQRVPVMPDYSIKKSFERPPAEYDNHKNDRFPVYNEWAKLQLKKSG